jgi:hypothetical protein
VNLDSERQTDAPPPSFEELGTADFIVLEPGRWGVLSIHATLPTAVPFPTVVQLLDLAEAPPRDPSLAPLAVDAVGFAPGSHPPVALSAQARAVSPVLAVRDEGGVVIEDWSGARHLLDQVDLTLWDGLADRDEWRSVTDLLDAVAGQTGVPVETLQERLHRLSVVTRVEINPA